jgi:hypothetical protein
MTRFLRRSLLQAGKLVNNPFWVDAPYNIPTPADAKRDFSIIIGDMRKVGRNLRSAVRVELKYHGR